RAPRPRGRPPRWLGPADAPRPPTPLGLLTNTGPLLLRALPAALPEIARRFASLLFSCRLRALKPTPALFAAVLRELGRPAAELLLIADSAANLQAARAASPQPLLHQEPAS